MLFFGDIHNKKLSEKVARELRIQVFYPEVTVFPDGERRVRIREDVKDSRVVILTGLGPPVDANIIELIFLLDALKRSGAAEVTCLISYLAYQRGDQVFRPGESSPLQVVTNMIQSAGTDRIMILDPHSTKLPSLIKIPVTHISVVSLYASKIREMNLNLSEISLVSPDRGGEDRVNELASLLQPTTSVVIHKKRDIHAGHLQTKGHKGIIRTKCFIIDDICSSGQTLLNAINYLSSNGADKIFVMCTHAVLSGNAPELLQNSVAEKTYMTDSLPIPKRKHFKKLEIISTAGTLAGSIRSD